MFLQNEPSTSTPVLLYGGASEGDALTSQNKGGLYSNPSDAYTSPNEEESYSVPCSGSYGGPFFKELTRIP